MAIGTLVRDGRHRIVPATLVMAGLLVVGAAVWGAWLERHGVLLHLSGGQPLTGRFDPRVPMMTVLPVAVAAVVVLLGPRVAASWPWRRVVLAGGLVAGLWALALALVDGPAAVGAPLATRWEYPHDVGRVGPLRPFLSGFTDHVLAGSPGFQWVTHVSGHPPGALLVFVGLDRLGLAGPGWAALVCIAVGASAVPAVLLTVRQLGGLRLARRAAPFVALAPTALWVATSADAFFCGVACWGVYALAWAAGRTGIASDVAAVAGGLLLGGVLFLSYGLVLVGVLAVAVVAVRRRVRPLLVGGAAVAAVVAGFAALGFRWWDGFFVAADRVREGPAWIDRPGVYFVVAGLAAVAICAGPAAVAGLATMTDAASRHRRAGTERDDSGVTSLVRADGVSLGPADGAPPGRADETSLGRAGVLPVAAAGVIVVALLSTLAKGEVERIFLPFTIWLLVAAAVLPAPRRWLAAQAAVALAVQLCWMLKW